VSEGRHPLTGKKVLVLTIYWPSKRFATEDLVGGAVAVKPVDEALQLQLADLLSLFDGSDEFNSSRDDDAVATLEHLQSLVPHLDEPEAQEEFARMTRSLFPADVNEEESVLLDDFFNLDGDVLLQRLSRRFRPQGLAVGGAAGTGDLPDLELQGGGAAGLGNTFSGIKNGASNLLNLFTFYEMKSRAGVIGVKGAHDLLLRVAQQHPTLRLHLVGHSFGCRLLSAAVSEGTGASMFKVQTLSLLQAAFSHWGFAENFEQMKNGRFRSVMADKRVTGPILITHTPNDKAVGMAYPIASRLRHQVASGVGDKNDPYGGLGRNGAQKTPEADLPDGTAALTLLAVGESYGGALKAGRVQNLEGSAFIPDHSGVTGPEVAHAILSAIETAV
jgi:hypothetical protein